MTGFSVEDLVESAVAAGVIGTLRKPLAIPELLKTIDTIAKAA